MQNIPKMHVKSLKNTKIYEKSASQVTLIGFQAFYTQMVVLIIDHVIQWFKRWLSGCEGAALGCRILVDNLLMRCATIGSCVWQPVLQGMEKSINFVKSGLLTNFIFAKRALLSAPNSFSELSFWQKRNSCVSLKRIKTKKNDIAKQ